MIYLLIYFIIDLELIGRIGLKNDFCSGKWFYVCIDKNDYDLCLDRLDKFFLLFRFGIDRARLLDKLL